MSEVLSPRAFWNSEKLSANLSIVIHPEPVGESRKIRDAAYELRLGPEVYISGDKEKRRLRMGDMVAIEPGQIALLLTEEEVEVPLDALGFISLKTSVKAPGVVNVSGFHVDPGFRGRLVFTVYNAGTEPYALTRGQKTFLIWFADLVAPEKDAHKGSRQRQTSIPAHDIGRLTTKGASPAHLNQRVSRLEIMEKVYGALLIAFFLAVATNFIRSAVETRASTGARTPDNEQTQSAPSTSSSGTDSSLLPIRGTLGSDEEGS